MRNIPGELKGLRQPLCIKEPSQCYRSGSNFRKQIKYANLGEAMKRDYSITLHGWIMLLDDGKKRRLPDTQSVFRINVNFKKTYIHPDQISFIKHLLILELLSFMEFTTNRVKKIERKNDCFTNLLIKYISKMNSKANRHTELLHWIEIRTFDSVN